MHVIFLLFTVDTAPKVQHSVVPGLIPTAAGVGETAAGVGETAAGVGETAAGVGVGLAGTTGVELDWVGKEFNTLSVKEAVPPAKHVTSYFIMPTVFGALKFSEARPELFKLNLV